MIRPGERRRGRKAAPEARQPVRDLRPTLYRSFSGSDGPVFPEKRQPDTRWAARRERTSRTIRDQERPVRDHERTDRKQGRERRQQHSQDEPHYRDGHATLLPIRPHWGAMLRVHAGTAAAQGSVRPALWRLRSYRFAVGNAGSQDSRRTVQSS